MEQCQTAEMEDSDDSYEMVNHEDFYIVMTDSEEDSSAESKPQTDGIESSDLENEDAFDEKSSDLENDDAFDGIESSDLENEDAFDGKSSDLENDDAFDGIESSDLDNEDPLDMYGRFQSKTVTLQKEDGSVFKFPVHIKRREDMEIKDLVKDHVLPFLPAKSLVRFRGVSKDWDQWIASPFLAHKQTYCFRDVSGFFRQYGNGAPTFMTLNQSAYGIPGSPFEFLPESVVVRSSCNGLLLCQGCDGECVYYICNPVNKEWTELPRPNYYHGFEPAIVLAFEPSVLNFPAHYQVICAVPLIDQPLVYFEIYSSEKKSWRRSAIDCVELGFSTVKDCGFYMKGTAYWETSCGKVLAFDLKNELHGILPLPCGSGSAPNGVLTQMHGELCYIHANNQTGNNAFIIDIYGGIDMGLKHNLELELELVGGVIEECRALPCVNSEVMMILIGNTVYSYHVRDQKVEVINRALNNFREARYLPYVNSLVTVAPN